MTNSQPTTFALYHYDSCPYCSKTRRSIDELGVEVELRNIKLNHQHQLELLQGGRKTQVSCLRIGKLTGESQWLYESDDIIDYLSRYQKELFRLTRMA